MCGTVALGLLGGLVASKLLFRGRFRHMRQGGGRFRRWQRFQPPAPSVDTRQRLHGLLAILELNPRQTDEAREAFADVAQALGPAFASWSGLDEALAAVAADPFDQARAKAAIGAVEQQKLAVDAFEHIHNILTPEQRDKLDQALLGKREWR
jgi:hypothetical protein